LCISKREMGRKKSLLLLRRWWGEMEPAATGKIWME
jgi:hypothetical protein